MVNEWAVHILLECILVIFVPVHNYIFTVCNVVAAR